MERMSFYPAQVYLRQVLTNWGIAPVSRQRVIDTFNSFISDKNDIFKGQKLENGDYFWQHIRQISPIWDTLGEIACRLHCSPCSEASCERTISMQRLVLTARRMSSKKELLDAISSFDASSRPSRITWVGVYSCSYKCPKFILEAWARMLIIFCDDIIHCDQPLWSELVGL